MKKVLSFLANAARELTGQLSSKRIIAFWGGFLMGCIVLTEVFIPIYATLMNREILPTVADHLRFLGTVVLVSIIGFVLTILGYNLNQNKAAIAAGIVKPENNETDASN